MSNIYRYTYTCAVLAWIIRTLLVCLLLANTILDVLIWLIHTGGLTGRLKIFLRVFSRTYERQNISTEPQKMALNAVLI